MKIISPVAKKLVQDTFKHQKLLLHVGSTLQEVQHGHIKIFMPKNQLLTQQHGSVHGGVVSYLADTAAGLSAYSVLTKSNQACVTVELKINFIKPCMTDLISIGKVLKENKTMMVTTAQVLNKENQLCAYMLQTIKRFQVDEKKQ